MTTTNKINKIAMYLLLSIIMCSGVLAIANDSNLVLHYTGENGLVDSSGHGFTPVNNSVQTTTTNCPSACGSCFTFDSASSYLNTTYISGDSQEITMFARVYKTDSDFANIMGTYNPIPEAHVIFYRDTTALFAYFTNNAIGLLDSAGTFAINQEWSFSTTIFANDTAYIYADGLLDNSNQENSGALTRAYLVGASGLGPENFFGGQICDISIWNRSLDAAEMLDLHTNGIVYPGAPADTPTIDLLFTNTTDAAYKTVFDEGENFITLVNWTNSTNIPLDPTLGNCSISIVNGLVETHAANDNFTICGDIACDFPIGYVEELNVGSISNAITDIVHFDGCHGNLLQGDITVDYECDGLSDSDTILALEMPSCSLGSAFVTSESTACLSSTKINVTISFLGQINRFKIVEDLAIDREYSVDVNTYSAEAYFNTTLNMWSTNHSHEFYEHGTKKIFANCTASNINLSANVTTNITIVNAPPIIFIEQVNTSLGITDLVDGVVIEYASGVWNWIGAIIDDDPDILNVTWYNSSGQMLLTFQGSPATTLLNTPDELFLDFVNGNPYSINVTVNDTNDNVTVASLNFNVTDDVDPVCNFSSNIFVPLENFTFNVGCTDENFYSLNVTCPRVNEAFFVDGLNVQSYLFNQSFMFNSSDTCSFRYCDAHTANKLLKYWDAVTSESKIEIRSNNMLVATVWTDTPGGVVTYNVTDDRLKYNFDLSSSVSDKFTFFVNTSANTNYLSSDKYMGWLVIDSLYWLDFNSQQLDESDKVKVKILGDGLFEVSIKAKDKNIMFESVGELNCVEGSFEVVGEFVYTLRPGTCPTTIAGVLTLWLVFLFACGLIVSGWVWKFRETGFFGSILMITMSWTIVACHLWAGYITAGIGMYYLLWFVLKK